MNHPNTDTTLNRDDPVLDEDLRSRMERRLVEERDRIRKDMETVLDKEDQPPAASSGDLSKLPTHPADAASEVDQADRDFRTAERSTQRLDAINGALRRLRERPEEYGACRVCGDVIEVERLELVPWTLHCADHAPETGEVQRDGSAEPR